MREAETTSSTRSVARVHGRLILLISGWGGLGLIRARSGPGVPTPPLLPPSFKADRRRILARIILRACRRTWSPLTGTP